MALSDRKIPIITGVNDIPSVTGQPKHPNASLLCKKFNDLIDNELTAMANGGVTRTPLTTDLYLDTNASTDGDGTEANPFNNVASLVAKLNSSIFLGSAVFVSGNVNFGDFVINATNASIKDFNDSEGYLSFYSSGDVPRNLTFTSIESNIPLLFNTPLKVLVTGGLKVRNSEVVADDITGNVFSVNSSLRVKTITNSIVNLFNSNLTLLDGVATNVQVDAVQSSVTVKNVTTPTSTSVDNLYVRGRESSVAIIDSTISNYDALVKCVQNSNVRVVGTTYEQTSTEGWAKVLTDASCTYYQKDCTGFQEGEPYDAALKVIDGVVV